jgi:hypothetical protein
MMANYLSPNSPVCSWKNALNCPLHTAECKSKDEKRHIREGLSEKISNFRHIFCLLSFKQSMGY